MNAFNPNQPFDDANLPADLRQLSASLDRLASFEHASAPAGLENRIAALSMSRLPNGAPQLRLTDRDAVVARTIYQRIGWQMRVAAAVAIFAGVGIAVLSIWGIKSGSTAASGTTTGQQVAMNTAAKDDAEFEAMIRGATALDTLAKADQVDAILADAQSLDQSGMGTLLPSDLTTSIEDSGLVQ